MVKAVATALYWFISVPDYPQVPWMPTHAVHCVLGKIPEFGEFTAFIVSKSKPALCPGKDVTSSLKVACCKDNSAKWTACIKSGQGLTFLVYPIRTCRVAQDPRWIASPSNTFLCAVNLNVNGKPFLISQILIYNSKLKQIIHCTVDCKQGICNSF